MPLIVAVLLPTDALLTRTVADEELSPVVKNHVPGPVCEITSHRYELGVPPLTDSDMLLNVKMALLPLAGVFDGPEMLTVGGGGGAVVVFVNVRSHDRT